MSDATTDAPPEWTPAQVEYLEAVAAALAELDGVTGKLTEWQEVGDGLYANRLALYLRLRDLKVPHRTIAAHTDASAEAVRVAIFKAANPGRPSRPPRKP